MKTLIYCYAVLSFLSFRLQAQDLTIEQIEQDFEFLNNALAEGHPGLYWFNSEQELNEVVDKVEEGLAEVTNVKELQTLFTDINNAISCGHTAILLPEDHYKKVDSINLFLPFNIALVEDKVLIRESFTGSLSRGDQVLSINNEPIDEIISELQRFIPIDKGILTKRARSIEVTFSYYYAIYKGSPGVYEIEYKNSKGKKLKGNIAAIGLNEDMYRSARDFAPAQIPIEWTIDTSRDLATLKLATFGPQSFKKNQINFRDTIKNIFTQLHDQNINQLIIDLRWNNGGNMRFAEYLFSFFIDSTSRYYGDAVVRQPVMEGIAKYVRSRNMLPMMSKQFGELSPKDGVYHLSGEKIMVSPTKPKFNGDLYLITNGFSFSATSAFIAGVQQNDLGLIIGETPGGAFDAVNAGPMMLAVLPNSKLRLYYRIIGSRYNVDKGKTRTKVDVEVDNTLKGFNTGLDEQLEYILDKIKK